MKDLKMRHVSRVRSQDVEASLGQEAAHRNTGQPCPRFSISIKDSHFLFEDAPPASPPRARPRHNGRPHWHRPCNRHPLPLPRRQRSHKLLPRPQRLRRSPPLITPHRCPRRHQSPRSDHKIHQRVGDPPPHRPRRYCAPRNRREAHRRDCEAVRSAGHIHLERRNL